MKTFLEFITEAPVAAPTQTALPEIYLDMDETIVDWMKGANKALVAAGYPEWNNSFWNKYSEEEADVIRWGVLNDTPNFWENLDFMPDGKAIWNFVKKYKPKILSACGSKAGSICREGKMRWLTKHLGMNNLSGVHLVTRSEKKKYAVVNGRPTILIDDYDKNCVEYKAAGGIPVKATTGSEVISKLKKIGFR
jgi:hypothetical protein